jgi:ribose-phosphate pyrophosphokinase
MELLLMLDAAKRASAKTVTAVIPYFGYSRQDRKDQPRVPISARMILDLIAAVGVDRMITMDLHSPQIQGFTNVPFDNLYSRIVLFNRLQQYNLNYDSGVVLAPDVGSAKMSQAYAKKLGLGFALIDKRRPTHNVAKVVNLIGDLNNKQVFIIDDMIDTAGTICNAAVTAIDNGATSVIAIATHPVLSGKAIERLEKSPIEKVIVSDTIEMSEDKIFNKLEIISISEIFAETIKRINSGESVSSLFK